jgi:ubiquinone/menaquinone biosynthesis C-methylase UbiE
MENKTSILKSKTTQEVWKKAQEWEKNHWINAQQIRARWGKNWIWRCLSILGIVPKYRGDDWNNWWKEQFNSYSFLPDHVQNAIEVGCGPYTNIRFMQPKCKMDYLVLSDPLIKTYTNFKLTFVNKMYQETGCALDSHPLENIPYKDNYFDLSVMINVLDHVKDANECMENLFRITRRGGIIIVGQDLSQEEDAQALLADPGLIGHPIKLHEKWFQPWIERCEPIVQKIISRENGGRNEEKHYATLIFAGKLIS